LAARRQRPAGDGGERRNKAIAPYALHPKQIIIFVTAITPGILIF
jgi:hypothetical protein